MFYNIKKFILAFLNRTKPVYSAIGFIILFFALSMSSYAVYDVIYRSENPTALMVDSTTDTPECNVMGINLHGSLETYLPKDIEDSDFVASENITYYIEQAEDDEKIRAIVLEVDSRGGYPVAAEEVANALKNAKKPTVALIRESGQSAAYWASTGADRIFASINSDVGSIGVTSSYLDNIGKNQKEGNNYIQLSAGKFKDAGDPDKVLTEEERAIFMRDLKIIHNNFIEAVSENRNMPIEKVHAIADGSSVLGAKAKNLGLIDEIGGISEVKKYLNKKIGEEVEICWY